MSGLGDIVAAGIELAPSAPKRCYRCSRRLTETEAMREADRMDADEALADEATERYDLVHCEGPEDRFTDDGRVIICRRCLDRIARPPRRTIDKHGYGPAIDGEYYCPACRCNRSDRAEKPNERCEPCTDPGCACHDEDWTEG